MFNFKSTSPVCGFITRAGLCTWTCHLSKWENVILPEATALYWTALSQASGNKSPQVEREKYLSYVAAIYKHATFCFTASAFLKEMLMWSEDDASVAAILAGCWGKPQLWRELWSNIIKIAVLMSDWHKGALFSTRFCFELWIMSRVKEQEKVRRISCNNSPSPHFSIKIFTMKKRKCVLIDIFKFKLNLKRNL